MLQEKANKDITRLDIRIKEYIETMIDINEKEELIGWAQTEFPDLIRAEQLLGPYNQLWSLIKDIDTNMKSWKADQVIFQLNAEDIEKDTKFMTIAAFKLNGQFDKSLKDQQNLINSIIKELNDFKIHMPLIKIFCNPGLKERHW